MDEIEEIKHRLDIVEVISTYLTLKKAGANMKGLCPFHHEKSPSFMVSPERQTFKCFGCGEGGDVFTFMEKIEGLDFYNALKLLADRAGVKLERESVKYGNIEHKADKKTRLFEINDWAKKLFHKILLEHPKAAHARSYLDGRGMSEKTVKEFEIGYAPDSWDLLLKFLQQRGYSAEEAVAAGVAIRGNQNKYFDRFRGRIMFPINNVMGHTIAFTSRVLQENAKEAKYLNSAESLIYRKGSVLYGLDKAKMAIKEANLAVMVEGQMDVIACHQAGFTNVVATSGTALTEEHLKIMTRYAPVVAFCFDTDEAGERAMKRAVEMALQHDVTAKIIAVMKPYKDPDEAIKADPKNWIRAVEASKPALEYWIDLLVRKNPDLSVIAKKNIAKEILPVIKQTYSEIEKESYIKYLAQKLSISERSLLDTLEKTKSQQVGRSAVQQVGGTAESAQPTELGVKERITALLWHSPGLLAKSPEGLAKQLMSDTIKSFLAMIEDREIKPEKVPAAEKLYLDQLVLLLGKSLDLENREGLEAEFAFLVQRLRQDQKEQQKIDFAEKIRQAEEAGDKNKVRELLAEYSGLIKYQNHDIIYLYH